jgi:hypothetical protein
MCSMSLFHASRFGEEMYPSKSSGSMSKEALSIVVSWQQTRLTLLLTLAASCLLQVLFTTADV